MPFQAPQGKQKKTGYLYGIHGVMITGLNADGSEPTTPVSHWVDTAQSASVELEVEEGETANLRGGDRILATVREDDTIVGANITFTNARFDAVATTAIAGGTLIEENVGSDTAPEYEIKGWEAPKMGDPKPDPIKVEIYVKNYRSDGSQEGFAKITLPFCKGRAPTIEPGDQEWTAPEFEIRGNENKALNMGPIRKEFVDTAPTGSSY